MGIDTAIAWAHDTANLWHGCKEIHPGCDHCYARAGDARWGGDHWGIQPRLMIKGVWDVFKKSQKLALESGKHRRIFVGSMMDIFEVPCSVVNRQGNSQTYIDSSGATQSMETSYLRDRYFNEVVPSTPNLLHLMLTKRAPNIRRYVPGEWIVNPPKNVMYGYSPVNQATTDGVDHLLKVPGRHFVSAEPLLGWLDLTEYLAPKWYGVSPSLAKQRGGLRFLEGRPISIARLRPKLDWVITGGESGPNARPMHPDWVRKIRDDCAAAGVNFFFKQWGAWLPYAAPTADHDNRKSIILSANGAIVERPTYAQAMSTAGDDWLMYNVGAHVAGNTLDGVQHMAVPV